MNVNELCTASQIGSHIWGANFDEDALVKAHIRHLRLKMEPNPTHPSYILTVPDVGYKLVVPDSDCF